MSEAEIVTRIDRIREKFRQLREADRDFSVFGSDRHEYLLGDPLTERNVREIEQELGVHFPAAYRLFLMRMGDGGAGPDYGLLTSDRGDSEDLTGIEQIRRPFRWTEAFNPYDWDDPRGMEDVWCSEDQAEDERPQVILRIPGALYICHHGCALWSFLVVNGQSLGEVWRDAQADDAGVLPECDQDGRHLDFLGWYEKWLDKGLRMPRNP